ncbi:type II and III secretion system protein family protein [Marinimicrobium sp. C2-29]|uniref:type II and III secretion system protein family protein n=1 Tax=Marinimicrobium sp. C2-29 TaxID=3139825 RepID=UPI0031391FAD
MNSFPGFDGRSRKRLARTDGRNSANFLLPLCLLFFLYGVGASAQSVIPIEEGAPSARLIANEQSIEVPLYKTRTLQLQRPVRRVSVGNADIADILMLRSSQIYIQGKTLGSTNVMLWDNSDNLLGAIDIEVVHDLNSLKSKLHQLMPSERIQVYTSQRSLVLAGEVSSAARLDTALRLAQSFTNGDDNVINLMGVGGSQQVMLKVTVAEVSRTMMRRLGIKFNALDTGDSEWITGGVNGGASVPGIQRDNGVSFFEVNPVTPLIDNTGLFASFLNETFLFNATLEASKETGSAKILAEPTLTTLSGQEARFLSGGELPIPVPQGDRGITVEFKEFGIGLKFLPVVLDSGRINLRINVSVSDLLSANAIVLQSEDTSSQFFVPALSTRSAYSTVELGDGQTIGIAGLISEDTRDTATKFPGLGDIPILGHLFRSQEFEQGETELVITVTPQLAQPVEERHAALRLPTDRYVEPAAWEFYLLGRTGGSSIHRPRSARTETSGGNRSDLQALPAPRSAAPEESRERPIPSQASQASQENLDESRERSTFSRETPKKESPEESGELPTSNGGTEGRFGHSLGQ